MITFASFYYRLVAFLVVTNVVASADPPCLFQFNSTLRQEGVIYSPNYPNPYPNNLNCRYEFYGLENELIILEPQDFQLESPNGASNHEINFMDFVETRGGQRDTETQAPKVNRELDKQCFYDFLDVFTANMYGTITWHSRHCGNTIQKRIVSTSPTLFLVFNTDRMLTYKGFKFHYTFSNLDIFPLITQPNRCGPSAITGHGGIISSPNYPNKYAPNTDCAWTITVAKHQTILIKFIDINLEETCKQSFVSIWDGYVYDVDKPDMIACDQLRFYHKGFKEYHTKSNRIVINFEGNKNRFQYRSKVHRQKRNENWRGDIGNLFDNKTKIKQGGFSIVWTAVHLEDECQGFRCEGGQYCIDSSDKLCHTTNTYCVDESLRCDGIYNCDYKDESDEKFCGLNYVISDFGPLLGFCVLIMVLIMFVFLVVRRLKMRRFERDLRRQIVDQEAENQYKQDYEIGRKVSRIVFSKEDTLNSTASAENNVSSKSTSRPCDVSMERKVLDERPVNTFKVTNLDIDPAKLGEGSLESQSKTCTSSIDEIYKSRDKLYTSISQHDMPPIVNADDSEENDLDAKNSIIRRNSYTLAISENG